MRLVLTLAPLIIASFLIACGPGITGENDELGKYVGEVVSTEGLVFYARLNEPDPSFSELFGRAVGFPIGNVINSEPGGIYGTKNNAAIKLDGTTGCVNFGKLNSLNLTKPFTMMALVNTTAPTVDGSIISSWAFAQKEWAFSITTGYSLQFNYTPDGTTEDARSLGGMGSGVWEHVTISVDQFGNMAAYVNGGFSGSTGGLGPIYQTNAADIYIGCRDGTPGVGAESNFFFGAISDVAIFNRALSDQDINRIAQSRYGN